MGSCTKKSSKKYTQRNSPPYPANEPGCKGKTMKGNDFQFYISKKGSNGVYRWVKKTLLKAKTHKKSSSKKRSTKKSSSIKHKSCKRESKNSKSKTRSTFGDELAKEFQTKQSAKKSSASKKNHLYVKNHVKNQLLK